MLKLCTSLLLCVLIAFFIFPSESFCVPHVALDESFNHNQQNQNLLWPWFTDLRNGIRWHYNAMNPHFRAEPESTPVSWGVQDFIFNRNVIENDEVNQAMWCAYTNRDNVNAPRWPEDDFYVQNQNAWMWWGPVDLTEAVEGRLSFWLYLELPEDAGDALHFVALTDANLLTSQGDNFIENVPIGISITEGNDEWEEFEFDLDELIVNGDADNPVSVLGEEEVYIAFVWHTDDSNVGRNRGAFIDDVSLIWEDGLDPQEINVDRDGINFGRVHIFDQREVDEVLTITNTGDINLQIENIESNSETFTVNFDDEFLINPGDSEEITITFAPPRGQFYEGILSITSDDPENEIIQVSLIGAGGNDALEVVNPVEDVFLDEDPGMVEIIVWDEVFRGDLVGIFFEGSPEELNMEFLRGVLRINPNENYNIPEGVEITLIAMDPFGQEVEDVFLITIAPVNDPPEVVNPIRNIQAWENDGLVWIAELDRVFFDVDGDELTYSFEGDEEEMRMGINDDNILFFNAEEDYYLLRRGVEIIVTAEDTDGAMVEDVFTLRIIMEDPWMPDRIEDIMVDEDPGRVFVADLDDVFDNEEMEFVFMFVDDTEELNMQIDEENVLSFNPEPNFNIPNGAEITILAENVEGEIWAGVFVVVILPVNDPPEVIQEIEDINIEQNPGLTEIVDLDDIFLDVDGDELAYSINDALEELRMSLNDENVLSFRPDRDLFMEEPIEITVTATDPDETTVEATFLLMLRAFELQVNAIDDVVIMEDTQDFEDVLIADLQEVFFFDNGNGLGREYGFRGAGEGLNMAIGGMEARLLFIMPEENYNDPEGEVITVFCEWREGEIVEDQFTLTILPVNDPPHIIDPIEDAVLQLNLGRRMIGELDDVFGDIDGDQLEYTFVGAPDELHMSINDDNRLLIDPERDFVNPEGFAITVTAIDPEGEAVSDEFRILLVDMEDIELQHFNDFVETGFSMALVVDELSLNERLAPFGWEIGIYTPGGILCGAEVWVWDQIGIPIWGDDPQTEEVEGFVDGERLVFRVWDNETNVEFDAFPRWGILRWAENDFAQRELIVDLSDINISLLEGWNMISTNVLPPAGMLNEDGLGDIILMTEQLRENEDNHHLQILKDEIGEFYAPAWNFNNIPFWDVTQGYQARVDSDVEMVFTGEPISFEADIPLSVGWNLIAYFPTYELDASHPDYRVLSPIIRHVIMAKNGTGQFMIPRFGFSNMEPWRETQGYHVNVDADLILSYPPEEDDNRALANAVKYPHLTEGQPLNEQVRTPDSRPELANESICKHALAEALVCRKSSNSRIPPTSENMSVLVRSIRGIEVHAGSEITAFNSTGNIVGSSSVNSKGQCGIAVWGDDVETTEIDGLQLGETFTLKCWDVGKDQELDLSTTKVLAGGGLIYKTDSFTVLEMSGTTIIPEQFFLSEPFPNPFNSTVRLNFGLPESAEVFISIFDIHGRKITTLTNSEFKTGIHSLTWDGSATASGIYFVGMTTGEFRSIRKITLVK